MVEHAQRAQRLDQRPSHGGQVHEGKKVGRAIQAGEESLGDMVAAVEWPPRVRPWSSNFALPVRPEVGQVTDIDVALVMRPARSRGCLDFVFRRARASTS